MIAAALALLLTQANGGALSFADVKAGDDLVYAIDSKQHLELRACEVSERTVRVAVEVQPHTGTLLDGVVVEVPRAPLSPPAQLAQPDGVRADDAAGRHFDTCGVWPLRGMHLPNGNIVRCEARELILGGGLISSHASWMSIRGDGGSWSYTLTRVASRPGPCPSWPRARLTGWATSRGDEGGQRTEWQAGSAWVRTTTRPLQQTDAGAAATTEDRYLLDLLIAWATTLPEVKPGPDRTFTVARHAVPVRPYVTRWKEDDDVEAVGESLWATPGALPDAPLEVRASVLSSQVTRIRPRFEPITEPSYQLLGFGLGPP